MDQDILTRLTILFRNVLDDDEIVLSRATVAADVAGWDSLANVRLMIATERTFGIKFTAAEIGNLKNVGDLIALIRGKPAKS
jgi:acyl carrier protein